ncbi:MAG: ABC transporter permease [Halodesulfurarchaeum sp.]
MRSNLRSRRRQFKRALIDRLIALKERLPEQFYTEPPATFGYALLVPSVLLIGTLFVGMVLLAYYSVLTHDPIEYLLYEPTIENWIEIARTTAFHEVFVRTFLLAAVVTVVSVALALPYAYLSIRIRSPIVRKLLLVSIFVPFFTGVIVRAYGWLIIFGRDGLLNSLLGVLGIGPVRFLASEVAVVIGLVQIMFPYAIIMIAPAIQSIDRSLELAASNLGANRIQTFRHVVIPLAMPGIAGATIVVFTITAATFAIPDIIGGGQVDFVANLIYRTLFDSSHLPRAAALSVLLVAITSVVVLAIFRTVGAGTFGVERGDNR